MYSKYIGANIATKHNILRQLCLHLALTTMVAQYSGKTFEYILCFGGFVCFVHNREKETK